MNNYNVFVYDTIDARAGVFPLGILPIAYCYCLLAIAFCLLLIAHCPLPLAYCLLPIAYCLLAIACCLLPLAYCLLPIAYCLSPVAYCYLQEAKESRPRCVCDPLRGDHRNQQGK